MKKISKLFLAFAASFMMFSCSSDEPGGGTPDSSKGDVYATLTLSLPQGSRAATGDWNGNTNSEDGFEVGNDSENKVGTVLVVLASKDDAGNYTYISHNLAGDQQIIGGSSSRPTYNVQFETDKLKDYADQKVYVFAYCNPTAVLIEKANAGFQGGFTNLTGNAAGTTPETVWAKDAFMMANAEILESNLPSLDDMNKKFNSPSTPFNLGAVNVSRLAVRFDFKQTTIEPNKPNLYPIYLKKDNNQDELMGYVQLDGMALMNQANEFYYLPRVSADGTNTGATLCGVETALNWVVSPNADKKIALPENSDTGNPLDLTWFKENYTNNIGEVLSDGKRVMNLSLLPYEAIGINLGADDDENWSDKDNPSFDKTGYMIWKYTTENTLPAIRAQRKDATTGVAFKGHIIGVEGSALETAIKSGKTLYAYAGVIYGNIDNVKAFIKTAENASHPFTVAIKATANIVGDVTDEKVIEKIDALVDANLATAASNGITIYKNSGSQEAPVYNVYYPYYNRHFDNENVNVMDIMEFAVVRNNIYKLKVDNILQFGHPGDPGDDPDPEDPDDPDETPKVYFRLQVKVLPWVVRVNNIIL